MHIKKLFEPSVTRITPKGCNNCYENIQYTKALLKLKSKSKTKKATPNIIENLRLFLNAN